ncbi:MAG: DUF2279 domain-containing protein [Flavobacteriales bacterium]|nr:DUF2279 domain-containing protein [Flavobacteriales bacterium]
MSRYQSILFCICLLFPLLSNAQLTDSTQIDFQKRKRILWTGTSVLYAGTLYGLNQLWYKDYPRSDFHFFNDNQQWLGVDKVGHVYSAYVSATTGIKAFEWAGYEKKEAALIGGSIGWVFLGTVEVFDGFSEEWGFSSGDLLANTIGSAVAIGQYLLWDEQIMRLKFSYSPTDYREIRPEILGENELQGILKDYNGQTYWASFNLNAIDNRVKPRWLNLAFGYGGDGMISAKGSYSDVELGQIDPRRQYYLSLDIDFERIPSNKKWVRTVLTALNYFKFPFPAIEWTEGAKPEFKAIHY